MPLDEDAVVGAGVALAEREGLGALGVRAVAAELGVTPMALYRHVDSAAALEEAVVAALLADLRSLPDDGPWDARCRAWAQDARSVIGRASGLPAHVLRHWIRLPSVLLALEGIVRVLDVDGPVDLDPVAGANAILMHVLMRAQAEESVRDAGLRRDLSTMRGMRDRLPTLWAAREEYRVARLDEHFAYGLDALLAGLHTARRAT